LRWVWIVLLIGLGLYFDHDVSSDSAKPATRTRFPKLRHYAILELRPRLGVTN